ncbi:hypothetical protein JCM8202_005719 [Rhodotorula sphaerocarpa]
MECGQEYAFENPEQFWSELDDLIRVPPDASLEELDYALRNYIAFASRFMDEYLSAPGALEHALLMLLDAPLFTAHLDRMIDNVVASIADPSASSATLFISLMLALYLKDSTNPLTAMTQASSSSAVATASAGPRKKGKSKTSAGITVGSSKIFRRMRRRWKEVVPVLMKWVWDAAVVEVDQTQPDQVPQVDGAGRVKHLGMPAEGWEERVGTTATAVLYEMCRVQKLDPEELADFSFEFVSHLFGLVERTRDAADETFNYTLIKLIIALNEQFMVSSVPVQATGQGKLPPPILPEVVGTHKRVRGPNTVLEVLKVKEHESKTFGENVIFILNRADNTPDSLCVSLLILKILYLLFTTSGTQEYFYTNDLCVLVDVFVRELYNLGEDSEGLKHTYLRVLHPLLNNTQLRQYPYKREELRRCLESLLEGAYYREVDPTTRRLVERNLRGTWCQGLRNCESGSGTALSPGASTQTAAAASTVSVDAIAVTGGDDEEDGAAPNGRRHHRQPSTSSSTSRHHHRKSRKHASNDDLRHHRMLGEGGPIEEHHERHDLDEEELGPRQTKPRVTVETDSAGPTRRARSRSSMEESHSPNQFYLARFDGDEVGRTGHDTLRPLAAGGPAHVPTRPSSAAALHGSVPPSRPPAEATSGRTPSPILQHPRPRSSSLSAACHTSLGLSSYHSSSSAPPTPPLPVPASPARSTASLAGSTDSLDPTSPTSTGGGSASFTAPRRRRPPPPPVLTGGENVSRPMTPLSRPPTTGTTDSGHSSQAPSRRRPPPPPPAAAASAKSGGGGREKSPEADESDARRALDGLAVSG